jgi:hypothetical protein
MRGARDRTGMLYRLAADLLVTVHMAYVLFVIAGFALVLLGIALRWRWIRGCWFRGVHLACILIVAAEALLGIPCPLTVWERKLRILAGQQTYQGDFVANWIHEALFIAAPSWVFTIVYTALALLVLAMFVLAPPRRRPHAIARPEELLRRLTKKINFDKRHHDG